MTATDHTMEDDSTVYKTLLESTKAIPWKIDWSTMQFAYIGPQIEQLLGWAPDSWKTANDWAERMHPEDRQWVVDFCVSQSKSGIDHEADYRALTKDGSYVWIRDVVHVVRKDDGEVDAMIDRYKEMYEDLVVVITGGDGDYLCSQLKNRFFANQNILLHGLNTILELNL